MSSRTFFVTFKAEGEREGEIRTARRSKCEEKNYCRLVQIVQPGTLTSSRKGLGREVLLSRATATLEAVQ